MVKDSAFAAWLKFIRAARAAVDNPSTREIAELSGVSHTTIAEMLNGRRLPNWKTSEKVLTALEAGLAATYLWTAAAKERAEGSISGPSVEDPETAGPPSTEPWSFNWHKEPSESFMQWAVIHLTMPPDGKVRGVDFIERYSDATDRFNDVRLTVQMNGVDVDPKYFFTCIERNMEHEVKQEAVRLSTAMLDTARLHDFTDEMGRILSDAERQLRSKLWEVMEAAGLKPDRSDDDD